MSKFDKLNSNRSFKLIEGKNGPTTFLPLKTKITAQARDIKDKEAICLTNDQARHIYKKIESASVTNIDTIKQDIDQDVDKIDDTNGEINPYHEIIVNKAERDDTIISKWNNGQY